jgi:hypothetical protein
MPFTILAWRGVLGQKNIGDLLVVLDGETQANSLAIDFNNGGGAPFFKHVADDA